MNREAQAAGLDTITNPRKISSNKPIHSSHQDLALLLTFSTLSPPTQHNTELAHSTQTHAMTTMEEEPKKLDPANKRFVIVGAGPVGLLAAILLVQEIDALQVRHARPKGDKGGHHNRR